MRVGNTGLIKSFLIFVLAVVWLMILLKDTVGGGIAGAVVQANDNRVSFSIVAASLLSGVSLLIVLLAAAVFRYYGRLSPFVTKAYARTLLLGGVGVSIAAAVIPFAYLARWVG